MSQRRLIALWIAIYGCITFWRAMPFQFFFLRENPYLRGAQNAAASSGKKDYYNIIIYLIGLLSIFEIIRNNRNLPQGLKNSAGMIIYIAFCLISTAWSDSPEYTARQFIALIVSTLFGCALSLRFLPNQQARIYFIALYISVILSMGAAILLPKYGVHQQADAFEKFHAGRWRGIYTHKNELGSMIGAGLMLVLTSPSTIVGKMGFRLFSAALFGFVLFKSGDSTATVLAFSISISIWLLTRTSGSFKVIALPLIITLGCIFLVLDIDPVQVLSAITHRDVATMSDRTGIWAMCFDAIKGSPIYGYGWQSNYGGFRQALLARYGINHPHNNFLDILLSTGLIGLSLFFLWLLQAAIAFRRYSVENPEQIGGATALAGLAVFWVLNGVSESVMSQTAAFNTLGVCVLTGILFWRRGAAPSLTALSRPTRGLRRRYGPHVKPEQSPLSDAYISADGTK